MYRGYEDEPGELKIEGDFARRAMAYINSSSTVSSLPLFEKPVFSRGGRMLKGAMSRITQRVSKGPITAAQRIEKQLQYRRIPKLYLIFTEEPIPGVRSGVTDEEDVLAIQRDCLKIFNFVLAEEGRTQILALWCIRELMITHPGLSQCLSDSYLVDQLKSLPLNQDESQSVLLLQETISLIQNRDQEQSRVFEMLDGAGLGPSTIVGRIDQSLRKDRLHKLHTLVMGFDLNFKSEYEKSAKEIIEDCSQLLSHLQTEHTTAQIKILQQIRKLVADHPGLDCCFYKHLDSFRAISAKVGGETVLKAELKETLASISDKRSAHATAFSELLLKEGCGPTAIVDHMYSDLCKDSIEILFALMVGCDLYGSQESRRSAKAIENYCYQLMSYVAMSKSHTLQALILNHIEVLIKMYPGLSYCFRTAHNLGTFRALMQQKGTRNMPLLSRTFKCIMDNHLHVDEKLQEFVIRNGYSVSILVPFSPAERLRQLLKQDSRSVVLSLLRQLDPADNASQVKEECTELMDLVVSGNALVQVLALKNLEQILFEYPDFGFFLVKEYADTIKSWKHDQLVDDYPKVKELKHTVAEFVEPKLPSTSVSDWRRSIPVDPMPGYSLRTLKSERN